MRKLEAIREAIKSKEPESLDTLTKTDTRSKPGYPSDKQIPTTILLKRKAIRVYPDSQKIALYYAQAIDKYISIPFGNEGASIPTVNEEALTEAKWPGQKNPLPPPEERRTSGYYADLANRTFAKAAEFEKNGSMEMARINHEFALRYASKHLALGGKEKDINLPANAPGKAPAAKPAEPAPKPAEPEKKKATSKELPPVSGSISIGPKKPFNQTAAGTRATSVKPKQKPAADVAATQNAAAKQNKKDATPAKQSFLDKLHPGETLMGRPPSGIEGLGYVAGRTTALAGAAAVHGALAGVNAIKRRLAARRAASAPAPAPTAAPAQASAPAPAPFKAPASPYKTTVSAKLKEQSISDELIDKALDVLERLSEENQSKFTALITESVERGMEFVSMCHK